MPSQSRYVFVTGLDCVTVRYGRTLIHMVSTGGDEYRYQRYLAMSIKAEASARGWTLTELATRAGIDYQSLLRKLNLKRHFLMGEVGQIADALGMRMSELTADAERRQDRESPVPDPGIHPEDADLIDKSDKLTRRQREQAKDALKDDPPETTRLPYRLNPGDSVTSSQRRPRRAGTA